MPLAVYMHKLEAAHHPDVVEKAAAQSSIPASRSIGCIPVVGCRVVCLSGMVIAIGSDPAA